MGITIAAACGMFLGLVVASAPAGADICGTIDIDDDCEIADEVLSWNLDQFEAFFPLDVDTCQTIAESVLKQCQSAVKSAAKCLASQINYIPKNAKAACKTEGDLAKQCNENFKAAAAEDIEELGAFVEQELDCCEDRAHAFYANCS